MKPKVSVAVHQPNKPKTCHFLMTKKLTLKDFFCSFVLRANSVFLETLHKYLTQFHQMTRVAEL